MMTNTALHPAHTPTLGETWQRVRTDPAYGAFALMRIGYTALPLCMGIDKFGNWMTYWPHYLAPWIVTLIPFSAQSAMYVIGAIEVVAGIAVAVKPRYAAYIVAVWLLGIIISLLSYPGFYDVALRDFGLLLGAVTLARLAYVYDPGWFGRNPNAADGHAR